MITYDLPTGSDERLWVEYARLGFGKGTGYPGFRFFIKAMVPGAEVTGTVLDGFALHFEREEDYAVFLLKWS